MSRPSPTMSVILATTVCAALLVFARNPLGAQDDRSDSGLSTTQSLREARQQYAAAQDRARVAREREQELLRQAEDAEFAAEKAQSEVALLAAQIQTVEASLASARSRLNLIRKERRTLERQLGDKREPVVQLTAALQRLTARPLALSALQPGSLRETVYLRAVLDQTIPAIREKTTSLRDQRERVRQLSRESVQTLAALAKNETVLARRRAQLIASTRRQRLASERAFGDAQLEAEKAARFAEQASSLDGLIARLDRAGEEEAELARLSGPIMRPADPTTQRIAASMKGSGASRIEAAATAGPRAYRLPVVGRVTGEFGERGRGGLRRSGIVLEPAAEAQVVAPAAGRVVFAGPYRGYGRIAIIEHGAGWTSLVTGLESLDVAIGDLLASGGPIGRASAAEPEVLLELRRAGKPVDPLDYVAD
ncbi:peptidoglycan DD-metalloendopeptidase family protein [Altererythrobacter aurantiacus]|uniref:Peptidoglycan DD-metalloendopeptidase family protein n=1 Tax=Parapontixanthobacter aurantiacus TaxID=1463599 RepID=A0A844ZE55_9SPHN|nr:peptidoglycan DD-metalloendopeptidase family protein [Parapontixanthobacter aurantiacus]MXO86801.1 peptidoglycan DD-metalloendopeptidase family protein [Parapontixanthobacter aurantiacus]